MKSLRIVSILVFAAAAACDRVPATPVEYRPEMSGTVDHAMCLLGFTGAPLRRLATGHQLVDVTLNGKAATFVLDTGANVSVVHAPFADHFGLSSQPGIGAAAIGLGGAMRATRARIDDLRIMEIRQPNIMKADLSQMTRVLGGSASGPIHGIIGQDLMREHHAVIDVASSILYLIPGTASPAPVAAERCATRTPPAGMPP